MAMIALAAGAAAGWFVAGLGNGKAPVEIAGITAERKYDIMLPVKN